MPVSLRPQDLQPGDILRYHGTQFISRLIRLFDRGDYSHAAIYDGKNVGSSWGYS